MNLGLSIKNVLRNMRIIYSCLFLVLFINKLAGATPIYSKQDSLLYEKYMIAFKSRSDVPLNRLITETVLYFRETPYVASTLESNKGEQLIVDLKQFDCTTFVETCIALGRAIQSGDLSFANYSKELKTIRYRGAQLGDYSSRLHYVTDWIWDNQKKKILTDITLSIGGITDDKVIDFMSTNSDKYLELKTNQGQRVKIKNIETDINKRNAYHYIPKADIYKFEDQIEDGDIVVFATSIRGLDYSHIGVAYHEGDQLKFIHASTKSMKVIIEPLSLSEYCMKSSRCTGITVLRLNDIKKH